MNRPIGLLLFVIMAAMASVALVVGAAPGSQEQYPAPQMQDGIIYDPDAFAYPAADVQSDPNVAPVVGAEANSAPAFAEPLGVQSSNQLISGIGFLWVSFLAGLLIFATAIVGALILFARTDETIGQDV